MGLAGPMSTQSATIGDYPLDVGETYPPNYDPTPFTADLVARTLEDGAEERLAFHFTEKAEVGDWRIRLTFTDGTFLDIVIAGDTGGTPVCGDSVCDPTETCTCTADCGAPQPGSRSPPSRSPSRSGR